MTAGQPSRPPRKAGVTEIVRVLCLTTCLLTSPAYAEKDVKAELAAKKSEQVTIEKKTKEIKSQIGDLKSKLVDTSKDLRTAEEGLNSSETRLKQLQANKTIYLNTAYKDEEAIGGIVTAARKYNSLSTPQLLLQSDPVDAARASLVMKSMLPAIQERSAYFRRQLAELARIENQITGQVEKQSQELNNLNTQKKKLAVLLEERGVVYKQTENDRKEQEAAVKKLAQQAKSIEDLVAKIQPPAEKEKVAAASTYKLPSSITLPVVGAVATGFGEKDDLGAKSEGVTFRAKSEASILTPLSGKVKFAGPFQKYKQILIIEHTGGYHSLIAGLGRIDTVVGASLEAGEPVGAAEKSTTETKVYYELRHNGQPVNPQKLSVAQRKQEKT